MKLILTICAFICIVLNTLDAQKNMLSSNISIELSKDTAYFQIKIYNNLKIDTTNELVNCYFIPLSNWNIHFAGLGKYNFSNEISLCEYSSIISCEIFDNMVYFPIISKLDPGDSLTIILKSKLLYSKIDSSCDSSKLWNNIYSLTYFNYDDFIKLINIYKRNIWSEFNDIDICNIDLDEYYKLSRTNAKVNKYFKKRKMKECDIKLFKLGFTGKLSGTFNIIKEP